MNRPHTKVGKTPMNATTQVAPNLPNIPLGRFEPLSVSASVVAEALQPLHDRNAKESFAQISTIQQRLQAERLGAERAIAALAAARLEQKRLEDLSDSLIEVSIGLGRMFGFEDIADFANQDDAWLLTVEGLVSAFNARGDFGRHYAERLNEIVVQSRAATVELVRATEAHANAIIAFSNSYRALSAAIAFGRAVLANLGVEVRRVAPAPKKKPTKDPVGSEESVPPPPAVPHS